MHRHWYHAPTHSEGGDMSKKPVAPVNALARLRQGSRPQATLSDMAAKAHGSPWLLLDTSASMRDDIRAWNEVDMRGKGVRKIDQLRAVVADLGNHFSERQITFGSTLDIRDDVPEPSGGTPLAEALQFAMEEGAEAIIIVSDGEPDDEDAALSAGALVKGQIDTFYVGPKNEVGEKFLKRLSKQSGGKHGVTDLTKPKELSAGIKGLLSMTVEEGRKGAIQL